MLHPLFRGKAQPATEETGARWNSSDIAHRWTLAQTRGCRCDRSAPWPQRGKHMSLSRCTVISVKCRWRTFSYCNALENQACTSLQLIYGNNIAPLRPVILKQFKSGSGFISSPRRSCESTPRSAVKSITLKWVSHSAASPETKWGARGISSQITWRRR